MRSSTLIPRASCSLTEATISRSAHAGLDHASNHKLREIPQSVGPCGRRTTEAFDLGKYLPDPVATFAASPNFRQGRVVAPSAWLELREIVPETSDRKVSDISRLRVKLRRSKEVRDWRATASCSCSCSCSCSARPRSEMAEVLLA